MTLRAVTGLFVAGVMVAACGGPTPQWRAVPPLSHARVVNLASVLAGPPWLVGGNTSDAGPPSVAMWSSTDRLAWAPEPMHGLTLDAPQNLVFAIAHQGGVWVATGETPGMAHGNPRPTIWRSTDGRAWSEVPTLREDFGGPRLVDIRTVTAGPAGFAVLGNWTGDAGQPVIAVWLSTDGLHWTRFDHAPALASRGGEELTAMDIAAGAGGYAIVGESYAPTAADAAIVNGFIATSPDGRTWTRADGDLSNGAQVAVRRVAAVGSSFVGIGTQTNPAGTRVAAWRPDPDGRWDVAPIGATPLVTGTAVAVDGSTTWVAVAAGGTIRIWQRRGGGRWRPADAPPTSDASTLALAVRDGRAVLAAQRGATAMMWAR